MSKKSPILVSGYHDEVKRSCYDCKSRCSHFSDWCCNTERIEKTGSRIANAVHCPFWESCLHVDDLPKPKWYDKLIGDNPLDNYIQIVGIDKVTEDFNNNI